MGRSLLVGNPGASWREWEKQHRGARDWVCLDPADANHGTPARLTVWHGDKPSHWRFFGSLDVQRFPQVWLATLANFRDRVGSDSVWQLFPYRPSPMLRHLAVLAAQILEPESILIASGTEIDLGCWPIGPEEIDLEPAMIAMVQAAQRKAHWLKLLEDGVDQTLDIHQVAIEGARAGSGNAISPGELQQLGAPQVRYAEACGSTLMMVADEPLADGLVARALAVHHCSRAHVVEPDAYRNLLCSFARQDGEDFAMGIVRDVDFAARKAQVLSTGVPPSPVRILRLGSLRVDPQGRELGEVRPWQV